MAGVVTLERPAEGVALVTLSDPGIRNRLSFDCVAQLADAIEEAREGGGRVCVLASGTPGHWYGHACLADLHGMVSGQPTSGDAMGWFRAIEQITHDELVTIAAITGDCAGGGAELGWACDLRIAEEQATFAQPEVVMGLATGLGGTSRLMRLIGPTATAEMVLDGAPVRARRIHELGGLNRVVGTGQGLAAALEWAGRLAARPAASLATAKKILKAAQELPLSQALTNEQQLFQSLALTPEGAEGMRRTQERLDAGELPSQIYGEPRD
jgi:enoyl-CoA hydratase/carnithine racemase